MKIKQIEVLVLTREERALLDNAEGFANEIDSGCAINGELESLAQAVSNAIYKLSNYEYIEDE